MSILDKRREHSLCRNIVYLLAGNNRQDNILSEVFEQLGFENGRQHDQSEVLGAIVDALTVVWINFIMKKFGTVNISQECKISKDLFVSYRYQSIVCTPCIRSYQPAEGNNDLLFLNVHPNEETQTMSRLVSRMLMYQDDCPQCGKETLLRRTTPDRTSTPKFLLAIVKR